MPDTPTTPAPDGRTSYDEVPYESHPFSQTHPDRLAVVASLFGLRPPPVPRCRVLELGCASGGNLIPMAEQLPEARFVGVDLSARQIEDGRQVVRHLGLTNVDLRHASILDVDEGYGTFDYLICHGVYSWVPPPVRDKILEIAARQIAPNGVAYVSYNTYPGWYMRGTIREMMRYHAANFASPVTRTRQARALLDFLATSVPESGGAYAALLKSELETVRHQADSYLFHEHLEEVNDPVFFYQFIERARAKGLQYLGEARIASMALSNFEPDVAKTLRMLATDQVQAEQYMDFLRNRMFRQTLLCRAGTPVKWTVRPESLRRLYLASRCEPVDGPVDPRKEDRVTFRAPGGATLATAQPLLKSALLRLRECWPQTLGLDRLRELAREGASEPGAPRPPAEEDRGRLGVGMLNAYLSGLVDLHAAPVPCVPTVSERPAASPLARWQAARGSRVTNRRHETVRLTELEGRLLSLLDGQHDRADLLKELTHAATSGAMEVERDDEILHDPDSLRLVLHEILDKSLRALAMNALLVG